MNLTPLRNNVIVEKLEKELTTSSGIILKSNDEADKAKVAPSTESSAPTDQE